MSSRVIGLTSLALVVLTSGLAEASTFDAATGKVAVERDLPLVQTFDGPEALNALPARYFQVDAQQGYKFFSASADSVNADSFVKDAAAIEGSGALRVRGDRALLLGNAETFAPFANARIEIKLWARADGAMPEMRAVYARSPLDPQETSFPMAQAVAFRTGRATSDGFIELSTGPIDGALRSSPLRGILLVAADTPASGTSFIVDALEIRRLEGPLLSNGNCSLATEKQDCQKGAVCAEGVCIDSALVYSPLPPEATRNDIVARTTTYLTRFQEDRHAHDAAVGDFASIMPGIAKSADTPDAFFRAYAAAIGRARGAHTSAPSPNPFTRVSAGAMGMIRGEASELNACFGIVEKDLVPGGGRGFGVYATVAPSPLAVGDVVATVDGEPIDTWLERITPSHGILSADPDADRPFHATMLHTIILRYGKTLVAKRCTAMNACTDVNIDLDKLRKEGYLSAKPIECSPRFKLAVAVPNGVDPNAYEAAISDVQNGIVAIHTNGEPMEDEKWVATVKTAFATAQDKLLVDKRRGDGGGGQALQTWGSLLRRDPSFGLFFVNRIDHAAIDGPPGFLSNIFLTCDGTQPFGTCGHGDLQTFPAAPGALPKKVAWLGVLDGSASDMAAFLAKGASGVRIFAPNRTMGLFGGLGVMGGFLPGWDGGAIQIGDTREGLTPDERVKGKWLSGRGVEPDEVVVQLQSDLLVAKDTMLERARAWLETP